MSASGRQSLYQSLTREKALVFRVTHRANLPWILEKGLHCSRSEVQDPRFVSIGHPELITRRAKSSVPISPGGTLGDYVPFYFTPFSPMLFNITTGYGGVQRRRKEELITLVSSLVDFQNTGVRYVFTDRHAYLINARYFSDRRDLEQVDFDLIQRRDFRRDPEDPEKVERYQAEALAYGHVPVGALKGVACYSQEIREEIEAAAACNGVRMKVIARPRWYE